MTIRDEVQALDVQGAATGRWDFRRLAMLDELLDLRSIGEDWINAMRDGECPGRADDEDAEIDRLLYDGTESAENYYAGDD